MGEITLKIGGEAGQGLQSIGQVLGKYFARRGYYVFANQDNESRIRGGHNFFQLRIATYPVKTFTDTVDVLIALDRVTVDMHVREMSEGGIGRFLKTIFRY